jgi:tetratricopeptide (TPR) repeat protein
MKAFLIVDGAIGQHIVPLIHDVPQLNAIHIFCNNQSGDEQWTKESIKIKGAHKDIQPISEVKQYNRDPIAVSFITMDEGASNVNLNQLDSSFMYTQIFKEILLEMQHNERSIKDFIQFWRLQYINNTVKLEDIAEFERDYCPQSAITWYTREYFIFETLNRALRTLESDAIIKMGFFIRDLHRQIEELHRKQIGGYHGKSFVVYRGQGLSKIDFEKLQKTKGGLMSFNNFLSANESKDVSFGSTMGASTNTDMVGILFRITIDPSISSAPFAYIQELDHFKTEGEILFSMHTVFRVGEINKIDNDDSLYQVDLKLTADDDQGLRTLTNRIQEEVQDETGWKRLGLLLQKLTHFDKAEQLYNSLLEQTSDPSEKRAYYNNLGYFEDQRGDYNKSIEYYEKALEIGRKILPANHPDLGTSYNNIGLMYHNMRKYSEALEFYKKALEIRQKTLPGNHPWLAISCNNIGLVYDNMGKYSEALEFYEKALEIRQKTLPSNHPDLAPFYSNIGGVYKNMEQYSKALEFYEKALEIRQKTLPGNHSDLAPFYSNIGGVYDNMGEYSKALEFYEKALEICQKILPANHPDLALFYSNIGGVHNNMKEYSKALEFYEKALEICQKILPGNHPDLSTSYNNIGLMYDNMGKYSEALEFYKKVLEIRQKTLPRNNLGLAVSYNNIGLVYDKMEEYSEALMFHKKALEIRQKALPRNHPWLAISYQNIGLVYDKMGEHSESLSYLKHALQIFESILPTNDPIIKSLREKIDYVNKKL